MITHLKLRILCQTQLRVGRPKDGGAPIANLRKRVGNPFAELRLFVTSPEIF